MDRHQYTAPPGFILSKLINKQINIYSSWTKLDGRVEYTFCQTSKKAKSNTHFKKVTENASPKMKDCGPWVSFVLRCLAKD